MSPRNQKLSATICLTPLLLAAPGATFADMVVNPNPESADTVYVGPGVAIPDNNAAGVTSVINVADSYSIASLTITINMGPPTHTWIGDLVLTLTHGATSIDLMRKVGSGTATGLGDSSDFGGSYVFTDAASTRLVDVANVAGAAVVVAPGNYRATNNIFNGNGSPTFTGEQIVNINAAFAGANVNGAWTLTLADTASGDTASLGSWSIDVTAVPEPSAFALLGVMAAGALGVRAWRKRKVA